MGWFYLPYYPVKGTFTSIEAVQHADKSVSIFSKNANWRMDNSKTAVLELLSMLDLAEGVVYISGLGLGLIALLVANKDTVTKVIVSEQSQEVIDFFNGQGFSTDKIKILHESWVDHKGVEPYDCVLLDHYDDLDVEQLRIDLKKFKANNSGKLQLDFFKWASVQSLKHLSPTQVDYYRYDVFKEDFDCSFIVSSLKQINARRTRSVA